MLGLLRGEVTARLGSRILVVVHDVGYWVQTGSWQPDGSVTVYLHHHVREDTNELYGFADLAILSLFEQLISVSGVGPKAALAILSLGSADQVVNAIRSDNTGFLSLAPGIGVKAAQKIILELKTKVNVPGGSEAVPSGTVHTDLIETLTALGYRPQDVAPILAQLPSELSTLDAQVKWVLTHKIK